MRLLFFIHSSCFRFEGSDARDARAFLARCPDRATVIEALSLEVATPDDARRILQLKGGNNVAF
jgi:hypothetical protein